MSDSESSDVPKLNRRRSIWRFSLRTMLILSAALAVFVALNIERLREYMNRRGLNVPTAFHIGSGKNILWSVPIGSQSYGGPVVADGKVFVGTNNISAYLSRYPANVDLGVLLCLNAADGEFLWQASSEKLPTGRAHDWPQQGITSTPTVDDDRLYYVTNRCELVCLDTEGFLDKEDDGVPIEDESLRLPEEADVVWRLDMMAELNVSPHNASCSSPCVAGDRVFVVTGNGVDPSHINIPSPEAPSFIAVNKHTGKLIWQDSSPRKNIVHGQWGSPAFGRLGGVPQVVFPGGDGWLYSFDPQGTADGKGKLLWKFDCNPKRSKWKLGGLGERNNLIGKPTIYRERVYMAVGQDPEHGDGKGMIWCIDPTRRGDVSPELVFNEASPNEPIAHKKLQACVPEEGDFTKPNPNSAAVWQYTGNDLDRDGKLAFDEEMHRTIGQVAVVNDLLFVTDTSGILHCVNTSTGRANWTYDMFAGTWASPVLSADHVLASDEDGDFEAFNISQNRATALPGGSPVSISMTNQSIYSTPTIHNDVLYLMTRNRLYAIGSPNAGK